MNQRDAPKGRFLWHLSFKYRRHRYFDITTGTNIIIFTMQTVSLFIGEEMLRRHLEVQRKPTGGYLNTEGTADAEDTERLILGVYQTLSVNFECGFFYCERKVKVAFEGTEETERKYLTPKEQRTQRTLKRRYKRGLRFLL